MQDAKDKLHYLLLKEEEALSCAICREIVNRPHMSVSPPDETQLLAQALYQAALRAFLLRLLHIRTCKVGRAKSNQSPLSLLQNSHWTFHAN